jgi:hypothetical protein
MGSRDAGQTVSPAPHGCRARVAEPHATMSVEVISGGIVVHIRLRAVREEV